MQLLFILLGISIIGFGILLVESIREINSFEITNYEIKIPSDAKENRSEVMNHLTESKEKVLVLSDLHNKEYGENNRNLVKSIQLIKPTMIWIAGDMLVGKADETIAPAIRLLTQLVNIAPVYMANGNHEQRMKECPDTYGSMFADFKEAILELGVVLLENDTIDIQLNGKRVHLTGLEIPFSYYKRGIYKNLGADVIEQCIGKKQSGYQVLLAHNPIHAKGYAQWGADLVVSGHLHGGIVRFPFLGGAITPQFRIFPKYSGGCYQLGRTKIVVSRGIGEHTIKIRFLNKPEIIVLHMK